MLNNKIGAVIMAAGHGTRMKSDLPKVMHKLHGKPLVEHAVLKVEESGCCEKPVVVICSIHTYVRDYLGDRVGYAVQQEQLGTAHAVASAEASLRGKVDHVVVLNSDIPLFKSKSLKKMVDKHIESDSVVTIVTSVLPDFEEWRAPMFSFGRIIRNKDGEIIKIVEKKDATEEELKMKEINVGYYCFESEWLWRNLKNVGNGNAQKEYYLNDLMDMAIASDLKIKSILVPAKEAVGVSTQEDLKVISNL